MICAMRLVLFDIDGTLLRCGAQVGPMFFDALRAVFGSVGSVPGYSFSGKTDPLIVFDLMAAAGFSEAEIRGRLREVHDRYAPRIEGELDPAQMELLPGVGELLAGLSRRDDVVLGLLTGNWERGARAKLARFDLNRYFAFGAFGDDGVQRPSLFPAGLRKAELHCGHRFSPEEVLLVGDTPLDVECAKVNGARIAAVATGRIRGEDLAAAGADWVLPDLRGALEQVPFAAERRR
ncbi:MAG: hydrolase [Acidobacteria bacterium]|nr:MAG: hydrolase [Acidobacteriota bacterium]REK05601.1 MAG: hydrolase [Acidobacteriota bacterium]